MVEGSRKRRGVKGEGIRCRRRRRRRRRTTRKVFRFVYSVD
jgi:hypothetical protein